MACSTSCGDLSFVVETDDSIWPLRGLSIYAGLVYLHVIAMTAIRSVFDEINALRILQALSHCHQC